VLRAHNLFAVFARDLYQRTHVPITVASYSLTQCWTLSKTISEIVIPSFLILLRILLFRYVSQLRHSRIEEIKVVLGNGHNLIIVLLIFLNVYTIVKKRAEFRLLNEYLIQL